MTNTLSDTRTGRICVSIAAETVAAAVAAAAQSAAAADLIEIRLDTLDRPEIAAFTAALSGPLLFTNRPAWEGGSFAGPEEERLALLHEAVASGAAYIDIELRAEPAGRQALLAAAGPSATRTIISWHDFSGTPAAGELAGIVTEMADSGARIGKIVTTAGDFQDVLRVLALQESAMKKGFPLIAFCMGRLGAISRLATLELGGYMTYAAPDSGRATAPGQLPVSVLRAMLHNLAGAE